MNIQSIGEKYKDYVLEKRRHLHMHPEKSFGEYETSKFVKKELDHLNIPYQEAAGTGVIARIQGAKPGKKILLRADMDALEVVEKTEVEYKSQCDGLMHACGHDAHTAMLLGAAHILSEVKNQLAGEVILIFQPAEEVAQGAKKILDENPDLLKDVDAVFAEHVWADVEVGKVDISSGPKMGAADIFSIDVKGISGHGSMPQQTIDATVVASAIVMNLQSIVSRNTDPLQALVITVGKLQSGTRFNVVSGSARLEGTSRSLDMDIWEKIPEQIQRVAENTAAAYGAQATFEIQRMTPPLINDENMVAQYRKSLVTLYGEDAIGSYGTTMGGEDFAYFTQKVPGAIAFVGCRNSAKNADHPHHSNYFNIDEDALEIGMNLYAQVAVDFLKDEN